MGTAEGMAALEELEQKKKQQEELEMKHKQLTRHPNNIQNQTMLRKLSSILPEILISKPDHDPLIGTAASWLQVVCCIQDIYDINYQTSSFTEGHSKVFKAKHKPTQEWVVLKPVNVNIHSSSGYAALRRTAHIMARLNHPHILPLQAVIRDIR